MQLIVLKIFFWECQNFKLQMSGTGNYKWKSFGSDFETAENLRSKKCQGQHLLAFFYFSAFFTSFSGQYLHNYFSELIVPLISWFLTKYFSFSEAITNYLLKVLMGILILVWIPFIKLSDVKVLPHSNFLRQFDKISYFPLSSLFFFSVLYNSISVLNSQSLVKTLNIC